MLDVGTIVHVDVECLCNLPESRAYPPLAMPVVLESIEHLIPNDVVRERMEMMLRMEIVICQGDECEQFARWMIDWKALHDRETNRKLRFHEMRSGRRGHRRSPIRRVDEHESGGLQEGRVEEGE